METETSPRERIRIASLIGPLLFGATVLALLTSAQHWVVMQLGAEDPTWRTVSHALRKEAPTWYLWVLAAPIVYWAVRRFPLRRGALPVTVPLHVAIALLMVLAHQAANLAVLRLTGFPTQPGAFWTVYASGLLFRLTYGLMGYTVLFGAVLAADYYHQFRERELAAAALGRQLAEARLQALRMQLNPHFLFNAMNTIAMLVRQKSDAQAVRMLAGLSDILRHVLVESPPQETPLKDELAFIERYLEIEQARFADRLRVSVDVAPEALEALVPTLVLQPLVENAIRHGVARRAAGGSLQIEARRQGDDLELLVRDDGPGLAPTKDSVTPASGIPISSGGIGLRNTRSRLTQLYGVRGSLELTSPRDGGAVARVRLPYRVGAGAVELEAVATE